MARKRWEGREEVKGSASKSGNGDAEEDAGMIKEGRRHGGHRRVVRRGNGRVKQGGFGDDRRREVWVRAVRWGRSVKRRDRRYWKGERRRGREESGGCSAWGKGKTWQ